MRQARSWHFRLSDDTSDRVGVEVCFALGTVNSLLGTRNAVVAVNGISAFSMAVIVFVFPAATTAAAATADAAKPFAAVTFVSSTSTTTCAVADGASAVAAVGVGCSSEAERR